MRKFIYGLMAFIVGTAFMVAPASSQEEEEPVKGGGTIASCVMLNHTEPYEPEFGTYTTGQEIDLEVQYETDEPVVLSYFILDGARLNESSTTDIQWVPQESGEFVISAEFYDTEGNALTVEDDSECSVTITVIGHSLLEPDVIEQPATPAMEPAPAATPVVTEAVTFTG